MMFIFIAGLMTALALALTLPAFLRPRRKDGAARDDNIAAARERLADLKSRAAAGEIDGDEASELEVEIQTQLLQEAEEKPPPKPPLISDRAGALATAAMLLICAPLLYWQIGEYRALTPPSQAEQMLAGLEARAAGGDLEALLWLARLAAAHNQFAAAADYYRRARAVGGDSPELLAAHLTVMLENPQADEREIDETLQRALALSPQNPLILWLAGMRADSRGDLETALDYWRQARDRLTDQPERRQTIAAIIAAAEAEINSAAKPAPETTKAPETAAATTPKAANEANETAAANAANAGVVVEVRLGEGVAVSPQTPLFVFAKAAGTADGPPLAVHRQSAAAVIGRALTVRLDDAAAMAPAFVMSDFAAYDITARLSAAAIAASGDWFGDAPATPGATVTIVINRRIP